MATKKKEVVQDVESELQRLTKKHKNLVERKTEVDQKLETAEAELNANRDQLAYTRRQLDETLIEKQVAEKSKTDIEASYRHLVELKKQNNKNIVSLQLQANTLDVKLQEYHKKEARHQDQKKHDLQAIDSQRHQLQTQQVYNARKLENEERQLQAKFQNTKAEIKRKFVKDLDELKQTHTNLINDESAKHKSKMDHLEKHVGDKIGDLQSESRAMRREYDILSLEIRELAERQARLEQTCKKEKLISATNGTDNVDWLAKAGLADGGHRSVIADQERVVNDLRQRYLATGDQLQVVTKQKQANTHALKKTKQDLDEQIRLFQLLEISKKDMERRLTKRNTELDEQLVRKKQVVANEHVTKKAKLQAEIDGKADECKDLQKQIYDLEAELSSIHLSTHSLSLRMNEKLEAERNHLHQLEEEKRDWEIRSRLMKVSVDTLTEQLASMEKETARLKGQAFAAQNDMVEEQDKNHLLEQSIKRLESRI